MKYWPDRIVRLCCHCSGSTIVGSVGAFSAADVQPNSTHCQLSRNRREFVIPASPFYRHLGLGWAKNKPFPPGLSGASSFDWIFLFNFGFDRGQVTKKKICIRLLLNMFIFKIELYNFHLIIIIFLFYFNQQSG